MVGVRWIYRFIPVPVLVCAVMPDRFDALALGVAVLVRPGSRDDEALIAHELVHCRQFYRSFGLNALRYWLSRDFRYQAELEAVREQLRINPAARSAAIQMLLTAYDLGVSRRQVENDL